MASPATLLAGPLLAAAAVPWVLLAWRILRMTGRSWRTVLAESGCLLLVEAAGLYATWPYFHAGLVGSGDIYHYALQLADGVTQARHGVFPLLVGQSAYAFNGNIHTLRTAPYYVHFGVALDLLTGGKLSFPALENLTVTLSTLGGALTAYYAARRLVPGRRLAAALLAGLYITGAGLLAPLYHYDMLATILTAPWLPLFWLGIALSLQWVDDREGLALSVFALAVLWYAHPPTAAWLLPALPAAQLLRLLLVGRAPGALWRPVLGAGAAVVLVAYEFYSVHHLHLGYSLSGGGSMPAVIVENLQAAWPAAVLQPLGHAVAPYSDLQLGYALWLILLAAALLSLRGGLAGAFLTAMALGYLALVLPVPGVTAWLWRLAPASLLDATNVWPMQRFYPILTAVAVFSGALALGRFVPRRPGSYRLLCGLLVAALGWNLTEVAVLQRRAHEQTFDAALSQKKLDPRNAALTRSSYLLFGRMPPYFSHGYMDPAFELRLLDRNQAVMTDNASAILRSGQSLPFIAISPYKEFTSDGVHDYLLNFQLPPGAAGSIVVQSNILDLSYILPESGGPLAFGSGPHSARTLPIRTAGRPIESVAILAAPAGIVMQAIPFRAESLPLKLESLIPLVAAVEASRPGYLETPRVFIPGYRATVNGAPAALIRSDAGLVAIPVAAGPSRVVLDYPGGAALRALYFTSLAALVAALAAVCWITLARPAREGAAEPLDAQAIRRHRLLAPDRAGG